MQTAATRAHVRDLDVALETFGADIPPPELVAARAFLEALEVGMGLTEIAGGELGVRRCVENDNE
jgi:hypothetical protein